MVSTFSRPVSYTHLDALDFLRLVDHGVDSPLAAFDGDGAFRLAEVESAGEFAHDEEVEAVGNPLGLDGRGVEPVSYTHLDVYKRQG